MVPSPGLLLLAENAERAARLIFHESSQLTTRQQGTQGPADVPRHRTQPDSTADVDFFTTKEVYPTSAERCHVNFVVLDGPRGNTWEEAVAQILEIMPQVAAYVKNDHLGFTIPYVFEGRSRQYLPDFLVRLKPLDERRDAHADRGGVWQPQASRANEGEGGHCLRNLWVPAVNNHGGFGRWSYCELKDPTRFRQDLDTAIGALQARIGASAVVAP